MIIMVQPTSNAFLFLSKATIFNFTVEPKWNSIISRVAFMNFADILSTLTYLNRVCLFLQILDAPCSFFVILFLFLEDSNIDDLLIYRGAI